MEFAASQQDVLLIDEGDHFLLEFPERFQKISNAVKMIVLSATSDGNDSEGTEAAVIKELGF